MAELVRRHSDHAVPPWWSHDPAEYRAILASALNVQAEALGIPVRPGRVDELASRVALAERRTEESLVPVPEVPDGWCGEVEAFMHGRICATCGRFAFMSDHPRNECRAAVVREIMDS